MIEYDIDEDVDGLTPYRHESTGEVTWAKQMGEEFVVDRGKTATSRGTPGDYVAKVSDGRLVIWRKTSFEQAHKPVEVFRPDDDVPAMKPCEKTAGAEARRVPHDFVVETPEGTMRAECGDYLMRGIEGELYPCDAEVFDQTYAWDDGENNDYDSRPETVEHIRRVRTLMMRVGQELTERAVQHDRTKLEPPEKPVYDEMTPKLEDCEYGSEEYEEYLERMDEALEHHYAAYRHHPEHFEDGIEGMHLVDLLEMMVDWYAAVERHDDDRGIHDSIAHNAERFGYGDELATILHNTAELIEGVDVDG